MGFSVQFKVLTDWAAVAPVDYDFVKDEILHNRPSTLDYEISLRADAPETPWELETETYLLGYGSTTVEWPPENKTNLGKQKH
jgi:hypothetical protein